MKTQEVQGERSESGQTPNQFFPNVKDGRFADKLYGLKNYGRRLLVGVSVYFLWCFSFIGAKVKEEKSSFSCIVRSEVEEKGRMEKRESRVR